MTVLITKLSTIIIIISIPAKKHTLIHHTRSLGVGVAVAADSCHVGILL